MWITTSKNLKKKGKGIKPQKPTCKFMRPSCGGSFNVQNLQSKADFKNQDTTRRIPAKQQPEDKLHGIKEPSNKADERPAAANVNQAQVFGEKIGKTQSVANVKDTRRISAHEKQKDIDEILGIKEATQNKTDRKSVV